MLWHDFSLDEWYGPIKDSWRSLISWILQTETCLSFLVPFLHVQPWHFLFFFNNAPPPVPSSGFLSPSVLATSNSRCLTILFLRRVNPHLQKHLNYYFLVTSSVLSISDHFATSRHACVNNRYLAHYTLHITIDHNRKTDPDTCTVTDKNTAPLRDVISCYHIQYWFVHDISCILGGNMGTTYYIWHLNFSFKFCNIHPCFANKDCCCELTRKEGAFLFFETPGLFQFTPCPLSCGLSLKLILLQNFIKFYILGKVRFLILGKSWAHWPSTMPIASKAS